MLTLITDCDTLYLEIIVGGSIMDNITRNDCGYDVTDKLDGCQNEEVSKNKKKNRKVIFGIIAGVLVLLIIYLGTYIFSDNRFISISVEEVQSRLLDPKSMIIYDCKINIDEDEINGALVYLYVGAKNKYGGYTDEEFMVKIENGRIDSSASSDDVDDFLTNDAAGELMFVKSMGMGEHWKTIDNEKAQKMVK